MGCKETWMEIGDYLRCSCTNINERLGWGWEQWRRWKCLYSTHTLRVELKCDVSRLVVEFSSFQSLSHIQLFATSWTTAHQSITNSRSLPKPMSIESVVPSNHLILCHPFLLLPSVFPSIRVFSNESALCIRWPKYWSFSFNISPSTGYQEGNRKSGLISFWIACLE